MLNVDVSNHSRIVTINRDHDMYEMIMFMCIEVCLYYIIVIIIIILLLLYLI